MSFRLRSSSSQQNVNHYNKWYKKYKSSRNSSKGLSSLGLLSSKVNNSSTSSKIKRNVSSNSKTETDSPDWTEIPSKTEKFSQEAMQKKIEALATKACEASSVAEKKAVNEEVLKLKTEYVSQASPDRKGLYSKAQKVIDNYNQRQKIISSNTSSLAYIFKDTDIANKKFALSNQGYVTATSFANGYNYHITTKDGNEVMKTVGGEWSYTMTTEEAEKQNEFFEKYAEAMNSIKKEMSAANKQEQKLAKTLNTNLCIDYSIDASTDVKENEPASNDYNVSV